MENQNKELTNEQEEIVNMISNVCPPVINKLLVKVNKFRKLFKTSTEVFGQINELVNPANNNHEENS